MGEWAPPSSPRTRCNQSFFLSHFLSRTLGRLLLSRRRHLVPAIQLSPPSQQQQLWYVSLSSFSFLKSLIFFFLFFLFFPVVFLVPPFDDCIPPFIGCSIIWFLSFECVTFLFLWGSYPFSRLSLWRPPIFLYSSVDFGLIFGGVKFNG